MDQEASVAAGRDMDSRLFRAFFGDRPREPVPAFSTELDAAWVLLQRLLREYRWVEVVGTADGGWTCRIQDPSYSDRTWLGSVAGVAPAAPLAIARAALRLAEARNDGTHAPLAANG